MLGNSVKVSVVCLEEREKINIRLLARNVFKYEHIGADAFIHEQNQGRVVWRESLTALKSVKLFT